MAINGTSTYQAGVVAASGSAFSPNKAPLNRKHRTAEFTVSVLGGHADGDHYDLGSLGIPGCYVRPESVKLRFGGTGTVDFKAQLKKVDNTGSNAVALTAASAEIAAMSAAIGLTAPDGTNTVLLAPSDMLRLYVNHNGAVTSTLSSCTTTSGSPTVTLSSTTGLGVGLFVAGPGIPVGATVSSFVTNTSFTLNVPATASGTGVALTAGVLTLPSTVTLYVEVPYDVE